MGTVPVLPTFTAGQVVTAAQLTALNTAISFLMAPPSAYAYRAAALSVGTSAWALIAYDNELLDTDTMVDIVGNPSRITIKTPGRFRIEGFANWAFNATGNRELMVRKNAAGSSVGGTQIQLAAVATAVTVSGTTQLISTEITFAANDYIEMFGWQNSGGALNIIGGQNQTYLQLRWMGT